MQAHAWGFVSHRGPQMWPGMGALAPYCASSLHPPLPTLPPPECGHALTCPPNLGFSQDNAVISDQTQDSQKKKPSVALFSSLPECHSNLV